MLSEIIAAKREVVQRAGREVPLEEVRRAAQAPELETRSLSRALCRRAEVSLIAELKRRSPSAGLIRPDFDPVRIAQIYEQAGAAALSVLTDQHYFGGHSEYLRQVRRVVELPLLRKDFIISDYQVYESRALGADAILLISAVLDDIELRDFQELATGLGMECLVEIHDRQELERAVASGAMLIGINNRNLHTFQTDLDTTKELAVHLPSDAVKVSESGIRSREDIVQLAAYGIDAVLVGETLMRAPDIGARVRELLEAEE
jgi:indole-3-glycerol phosphate synthase